MKLFVGWCIEPFKYDDDTAHGEYYLQTKFSSRRRSSNILLRHYITLFFIQEITFVSSLKTPAKKTNLLLQRCGKSY